MFALLTEPASWEQERSVCFHKFPDFWLKSSVPVRVCPTRGDFSASWRLVDCEMGKCSSNLRERIFLSQKKLWFGHWPSQSSAGSKMKILDSSWDWKYTCPFFMSHCWVFKYLKSWLRKGVCFGRFCKWRCMTGRQDSCSFFTSRAHTVPDTGVQ